MSASTNVEEVHPFAHRRARLAGAFVGLLAVGGLVAGAGAASAASAPQQRHAAVLISARTERYSKAKSAHATLPQCGATRDPFDPTNSAAPAGSPTC